MSTAVCRVCIIGDVRMHRIEKELQEIYEKLTGSQLSTYDEIPKTVCFICYSQLQRCWKFSKIALQSEEYLKHQLNHGKENGKHQKLSPNPLLNLQVVENLSVTVAQSVFTDAQSENIPENLHSNQCATNETNPTSVKIEIEVKKEDDAEDLVKSEQIIADVEDDGSQNTESLKSSNIANNPNNKSHYCDLCNKEFESKTQMRTHLKTHKGKPLTCDKCEKTFVKMHYFKQHVKTCTPFRPGTVHSCSSCDKTFSKIIYLKKHIKTHSEDRPFTCNQCNNRFKTRDYLKIHMHSHSNRKSIACEVCGKMFMRISNLKTHMKIHEGIKPFACEICGNAFITNSSLKSHMKYHTRERPFSCDTCGAKFGQKQSLNLHIQKVHIEVKAYPCDRCHMSFNQELRLRAHMKAHIRARAYPCDKCSKVFTSPHSFKMHNMQVHSGERRHICPNCGKTCKRPEHLRLHMNTFKCKAHTPQQTNLLIPAVTN